MITLSKITGHAKHALIVLTLCTVSCTDQGEDVPPAGIVASDAEFFRHITQTDLFTSYTLFPNADSVTSGSLNGSTAHQPLVRVSLNSIAAAALSNGILPNGTSFPNGSVIFKQIILGGQTALYAAILKDLANELSGNGWLWAEYQPDGTVVIPVARRGSNCIACHAREQGPRNDFVRTFERQR